MRKALIALSALLIAAPLAAQGSMNADVFYRKASALQAKGMMAMFSSDLKPLMAEIKGVSERLKAQNAVATKAGKPIYCPPANAAKKGMSSEEIVARFGKIPQAERQKLTVADVWRRIAIERNPCK